MVANLQQLIDETEYLATARIGDMEFELTHNTRTGSYMATTEGGHHWYPSTDKDRRVKAIRDFLADIADELAARYES